MKEIDKIETVIFDMDGTALNNAKEMDKLLVKYRQEIKDAGVTLMIASGRLDAMVFNYMNELELDTPIIGSNGATITYQDKSKEPLHIVELDKEKLQACIDLAKRHNATYHVFTVDGLYGPKKEARLAYYSDSNESKTTEEQVTIDIGEKYEHAKNFDRPVKFLLVTEDRDVRREFEQLAKKLNLIGVESGDELFDIMSEGVSKGAAIHQLAEQGIIDLNTTLVFGDNYNDLEMLQTAKYAIVMENAEPAIQSFAWDICPENNVSGVGQYVLTQLGIPYEESETR